MPADRSVFRARRERAAAACREAGIAALLLSPGSDLTYLSGYRLHGSERLTCLVLPADGAPFLVVPALEAPRAAAAVTDCELHVWQETDDPAALVASLVTADGPVAVADHMWALFVLRLQRAMRG
ncbi:MAG: aminopeptidase P family N-terminal domain-containing protein, partial [Solirubrobacteraceae bacterium]